MWKLLTHVFDREELALINSKLNLLIRYQEKLTMSLKETKDVLTSNNDAIGNIENDVTRLHDKIKELSEQQPNDPLVAEILGIAQAQKARLDALAGQTPEDDDEEEEETTKPAE